MLKKILPIIIFITVSGGAIFFMYKIINNNNESDKASKIFGNNFCDVVLHMATNDLAHHNCKVCGKKFQDSSMREDICDECAKETGRCDFCGKKKKE